MSKSNISSDHKRIDERSIALHKAIVRCLKYNPKLIRIARDNLRRWKKQYRLDGREIPLWLFEWERRLNQKPLEKILELLVFPDERARRLRQSSPFAGILSNKERTKIYESYAIGTYYSGRRKYRWR